MANERKIFLMAKGFQSPKPLQVTSGPSQTNIGDLNSEVISKAMALFEERLGEALQQVSARAEGEAGRLRDLAISAINVSGGIDFATHMELMPMFLQPVFVLVVLGDMEEAHMMTYGFIAETPHQVEGDRPEAKRTSFCVRLVSPNLLAPPDAAKEVWYSVRNVHTTAMSQVVDGDVDLMRLAATSSSLEPLVGDAKWGRGPGLSVRD